MAERADLEAAIFADPDAREPYAVYADWLLERGDPEGELIAVQLALELSPDDPALQAREAELLAAADDRLKSLYHYAVDRAVSSPVWRRGVLHSLQIRGDAYSNTTANAYRELLADPQSRFLRELTLFPETSIHGENRTDTDLVDAIAACGVPRALRRLSFEPFEFQLSWSYLTDLTSIYRHLGRLHELSISAGDITLGSIDLPELRTMTVITGGLRAHALDSVIAAKWPKLESLVLYLGGDTYGGQITPPMLAPILEGDVIPRGVSRLGLCNCAFGDELVEELARSRILPRLAHLDLYDGTIGDDGARTLLAHAPAFRHLESLDLRWNYLSAAHRTAVAAIGPDVVFGDQRMAEDGERYAALGE